ncbi:MAG: HEAT repeat domain-containing protein [Planctomycetota bacterium]
MLQRSLRVGPLVKLVLALWLAAPGLGAQLDIPAGGRRVPARPAGPELPPVPGGGASTGELELPEGRTSTGALASTYSADDEGRARFLFDQLDTARKLDSTIVAEAEEQLARLGEVGLAAARRALAGNTDATLLVATRVLLRGGTPDDRRRVADRLTRKLPSRVATLVLDALAAADPVIVSPDYLVRLLDHPTGGMRTAAARRLNGKVDARHFAALTKVLRASRRDTRQRAVELLATIDDPAVERALVDKLGDSASTVAWAAASALADRVSETLDEALLERALGAGHFDRGAAYALLAIAEREDRSRRSLLDDGHVERLRDALRSKDALVVGAAATALAGIGFHSAVPGPRQWLDQTVPHELVRIASGAEFHADFASLQGPVQRRLQRISGQAFGSDGGEWARWWTEAAPNFRARRAVIALAPGDELELELFLRDGSTARTSGSEGGAKSGDLLLGPRVGRPRTQVAPSTNIVYLTESQVRALTQFLDAEGVLGVQHLPRTERNLLANLRVLDIAVGEQGKRFEIAALRPAPWFDVVSERVHAFVETNSWQRYFPSADFADRQAFWLQERTFWESNADPARARAKRRDYVLAFLAEGRQERREEAIAELVELSTGPRGGLSAAQLPSLFDVVFQERYLTARATALLEIGIEAARNADGVVPPTLANNLIERAVLAWGDEAQPAAVSVLAASELATTSLLAASDDPRARRFAAAALGEIDGRAAEDRLLKLLGDPDPSVEVAAIRAAGDRRLERARDELLLRARLSSPEVRIASLYAIGRLGGEGVRDALLVALVEPVPAFNLAAVEALAELEDPAAAELLARVFARGPDDPSFEAAREGLRRLGAHAVDEILRLTASAAPRTRREAALLLAECGVPDAAPVLIAWLTDHTDDARVASELAILTGTDYAGARDPAESWWSWWDQVVHDDALAWYLAALQREDRHPPAAAEFRDAGTREGALYLCERLADEERYLAQRAERELGRLLGRRLELTPTRGGLREREVEAVRLEIHARFAQ